MTDGRRAVCGPDGHSPSSVVAALDARVSAGTVVQAAAAGIVAIAVPWTNVPWGRARQVKSTTVAASDLGADSQGAGDRLVIFLSSVDAPANAVVVELFDAAGCFPIDVSDVVRRAHAAAGRPLPSQNLARIPPAG